jgi:O-antigen ligase
VILALIIFFVSIIYFNHDFAISFSSLKHYAFYPLFYFVTIFAFKDKKQLMLVFKFALAGAITIIFFIIYGLIAGQGLWTEYTPLSTEGVRTLAFTHAFYLSLASLGLLTYLAFGKNNQGLNPDWKGKNKKLFYTLLFIWAIGIIGSMMRHIWGGLALAVALLYFILPSTEKKTLRMLIGKILVVLFITFIFLSYFYILFPNSSLNQKVDSIVSVIYSRTHSLVYAENDESFFWRNIVWRETIKEYVKHPFLGIGFGRVISVEIESYRDYIEVRNIHNSLLVILVQMGLAGLFLILMMIWSNLKKLLLKADKDWMDVFLLSTLAFYFFILLFQPYLETNLLAIFFWIILGLMRVITYENIRNKQV